MRASRDSNAPADPGATADAVTRDPFES